MALARRLQQISLKEIVVGMMIIALVVLMITQQRRLITAQNRIEELIRQIQTTTPQRPFIEMDGSTQPVRYKSNASIAVSGYAHLPIGFPVRSPVWFKAKLIGACSSRVVYDDTFMASYSANPRRADFIHHIRNTGNFEVGTYLLVVAVLDDHEETMCETTALVEVAE